MPTTFRRIAIVLSLWLLPFSELMAGDPYRGISQGVAAAAGKAGLKTVRLLPMVRADGKITPEGRMIAGRLLGNLLQQRAISVMIGDAAGSGALEPYLSGMDAQQGQEFSKRLGLPADGAFADIVVSGSYLMIRDQVEVNVQAFATQTGKVLFAATERVENEWPAAWPELADLREAPAPAAQARPAAAAPSQAAPAQPPAKDRLEGWPSLSVVAAEGKEKPVVKAVPVEFSFKADEAKKVELMGSFLFRTKGRVEMSRDGENVWRSTIFLNPGRYRYHFLVDGLKRAVDPANPKKEGRYSILTVP